MSNERKTENELKQSTRFRRLVRVVSCSSTQDLALADALETQDTADDAIFWADHQSKGRGRQEREWHDEPGTDLLATFRIRQALPSPSALPAVLPAATVAAIEPLVGRKLRIKWPNDVFLDGRKLAGMLIDSGVAGSNIFLIGIGVNCNRVRFPPDLEVIATSLALATGQEVDREALLLALARSLDDALTRIIARNCDELLALFRDRLGLLDRAVVVSGAEEHRGRLTAIDFTELELDDSRVLPLGFVRGIRADQPAS